VVLLGHAISGRKSRCGQMLRPLTPFLDRYRDLAGGVEALTVRISAAQAWGIVTDSFRKHMLPLAGAVWAAITFPGESGEPVERQRTRDALFLGSLLIVLTLLHGYATLGLTYCPYCLMNYSDSSRPLGSSSWPSPGPTGCPG
jgi:hypothetical protein